MQVIVSSNTHQVFSSLDNSFEVSRIFLGISAVPNNSSGSVKNLKRETFKRTRSESLRETLTPEISAFLQHLYKWLPASIFILLGSYRIGFEYLL